MNRNTHFSLLSKLGIYNIWGGREGGIHHQFFIYIVIMLLAVYNEGLLRVPSG